MSDSVFDALYTLFGSNNNPQLVAPSSGYLYKEPRCAPRFACPAPGPEDQAKNQIL